MGFGIWFEPEMVSPDSDLYRAHPDWIIRSSLYDPVLSRTQYVLDLSNPEVCDFIYQSVADILEKTKASYVKWDMNRHITDLGIRLSEREMPAGTFSPVYTGTLFNIGTTQPEFPGGVI